MNSHKLTPVDVHIRTHAYNQAYIHMYTCSYIHSYTHTLSPIHIYTYNNTLTHIITHSLKHTHARNDRPTDTQNSLFLIIIYLPLHPTHINAPTLTYAKFINRRESNSQEHTHPHTNSPTHENKCTPQNTHAPNMYNNIHTHHIIMTHIITHTFKSKCIHILYICKEGEKKGLT